jgi:hypothetical protein
MCIARVASGASPIHVRVMQENPILARAWGELFQTERSAERHPLVEAERLGDVPPAMPMRLVSAHATNSLATLEGLARSRGHGAATAGRAVGDFFSEMRQKLADLTLTQEMSYRGTLLGIRHGIDLVTLVHYAAAQVDPELHAWTLEWIDERTRLVETATRELAWFAANPELAEKAVVANILGDMAKQIS